MYTHDAFDDAWEQYRQNHPFKWSELKEWAKSLVLVTGTVMGFVIAALVIDEVGCAISNKIKEKKEVRKEQKQKQQKQIEYEEAMKIKIQMNNGNRLLKLQDKSTQR